MDDRMNYNWIFIVALLSIGLANATTIINTSWTPYGFSNCQTSIVNGNIVYTMVPLSQVNLSGIFCTAAANFPWYPEVLLITFYLSILLLLRLSAINKTAVIGGGAGLIFAIVFFSMADKCGSACDGDRNTCRCGVPIMAFE